MTTVGARTRVGAVIGWPVEHSRSPALHNAAFAASGIDAVFVALPVAPGDVVAAVRGMASMGFLGASVTVPHKQAAMGACDRLDPSAEAVGAVNCLCFDDGAVIGHNTDAGGFVDALAELASGDPTGRRALLLGAGGAARAVAAGLRGAGAEVAVIARAPERVGWIEATPWTAAVLDRSVANCDILVDCTSAGLSADGERRLPAPVPIDALPPAAIVASLVYHRETALLAAARARGLTAIDGAGMLVHQGARAFALWTGQSAPVNAMWRAMRDDD